MNFYKTENVENILFHVSLSRWENLYIIYVLCIKEKIEKKITSVLQSKMTLV